MSDNPNTAAETQVSPSDVLFQEVYLPEFVKQCEARGLVVDTQDPDQMGDLLKIAYSLRVRAMAEHEHAMQDTGVLLKQAASALEAHTFGTTSADVETSVAAASNALSNPSVAQAVAAVVKG
jgi:hypothetical protein